MRVQVVHKRGPTTTGIARYAENIERALRGFASVDTNYPEPFPPSGAVRRGLRRLGLDADAFFASYPLRLRQAHPDVYHLMTQTMATLLAGQRFDAPVVLTVHDIIPHLVRGDPQLDTFRHPVDRLFFTIALRAMRRADGLIAISHYTKNTLVEHAGVPAQAIDVVHYGIDHTVFRPTAVSDELRARYGLTADRRHVLYVGSDDPRKNLRWLVRAFARLRRRDDRAVLLVVGPAQFVEARARLMAEIASLGIVNHVRLFPSVSHGELALLYNAVDIFAFPSLHEGFGLPPLEAMACGTPVVCARAASVPEVVADGGVLVEPGDTEGLAAALGGLLADTAARRELGERGRRRAAQFTWERAAAETISVYDRARRA